MSGIIDIVSMAGVRAVGVIDFNGAGEAAMTVTIGGTVYTEADAADAANGVFTNGATAATSATSLAAAINDDTRIDSVKISAVVSDVGDSVVVAHDEPGTAGNLTVTTTSAANCTVEDMHDGADNSRMKLATHQYVVTAQDVLADEVNIVLPFVPTGFDVQVTDTNGTVKATPVTVAASIAAAPDRILINFAGATDPIAGDIVKCSAWARD